MAKRYHITIWNIREAGPVVFHKAIIAECIILAKNKVVAIEYVEDEIVSGSCLDDYFSALGDIEIEVSAIKQKRSHDKITGSRAILVMFDCPIPNYVFSLESSKELIQRYWSVIPGNED